MPKRNIAIEERRGATPLRKALLLVDHGSRRAQANQLLVELASAIRERRPGEIVEIAHMEIASPSIADGIAKCLRAGAQSIVIHPYFLGPGRHTQESIPELVARASERHPGLEIRVGQPLGLHPGVIDAVLDRIDEASSPP